MISFERSDCMFATNMRHRLRGLLGTTPSWGNGSTVLLLAPCNSIHTFWMNYPIDVAFADHTGKVISSFRNVAPWHIKRCRSACITLERPSAPTYWLEPGMQIRIDFSAQELVDEHGKCGKTK